MKHRILIEFSADTLPDDFLDQISGRVYGHPAVDKKECTAYFVGDVLKDAGRWQYSMAIGPNQSMNLLDVYDDWNGEGEFADAIDAAKGT
jgi:hypothetical protein